MDTIVLRKLTKKATLKFGRFKDTRIETLIGMRKEEYVISIYFKVSKITFTDDVLKELGFRENHRIEKPGKSLFKFKEFSKLNFKEKNPINKKLEKFKKETTSYRKEF